MLDRGENSAAGSHGGIASVHRLAVTVRVVLRVWPVLGAPVLGVGLDVLVLDVFALEALRRPRPLHWSCQNLLVTRALRLGGRRRRRRVGAPEGGARGRGGEAGGDEEGEDVARHHVGCFFSADG